MSDETLLDRAKWELYRALKEAQRDDVDEILFVALSRTVAVRRHLFK